MNQRIRILMTMYKFVHLRYVIERLYESRKKERRGLTSNEDSVNELIQKFKNYIKKNRERLITVTRKNTDNTIINRKTTTRKQKWEEKYLYEYLKRQVKSLKKIWTWIRKGNLYRETESL